MKPIHKISTIFIAMTLIVILLGAMVPSRYFYLGFVTLVVLFSIVTFMLLTVFYIKPLEMKLKETQKQKIQKDIVKKKIPETQSNNPECIVPLTRYDHLTALPNRIFFNEILNKTLNHVKRRNKMLAILMIDLNAFKNINQDFGNAAGDFVLKEMGNRFKNVLRAEDIIARLEGDQFIVLLNDIEKPKFASSVAEKLLSVTQQTIHFESREINVTARIGICIYPHDGESLESLLKNVDIALYKSKNSNGNNYQFYTKEIDSEAREFIQLENALKNAIQNNEFVLYYQPKLNVKKGKITGVEALLRWEHPKLGILDPSKFIPVAEETGLIMQVGEWVLREACRTNKFWQAEGYEHISVAVNLSPKQFQHPKMAEIITTILNETQLNPNYLEIEINEETVMQDADAAQKILETIKATGVRISIDHFGTGYISISHLKQFPISILKIDRSFVKGIPQNPNDNAITNAFIGLAHHLGFESIAEGVETAEQVQYLSGQNCDVIQGYFLSHPLPAQKIVLQFKKLIDEVLI